MKILTTANVDQAIAMIEEHLLNGETVIVKDPTGDVYHVKQLELDPRKFPVLRSTCLTGQLSGSEVLLSTGLARTVVAV